MLLKKYLIDSKITLTRVKCIPDGDGICATCKYWDKTANKKGCLNILIQESEALVDRCYDVSEKVSYPYLYEDVRTYDYNIQNTADVKKEG